MEIRVVRGADHHPERDLDARIETIWSEAVRTSGGNLFNGSIVSVLDITSRRIDVQIDEYRRWIAARADRSLASALRIRPLAVSGLLRCADGLVFGRRSGRNTEAAGQWELAPSGGFDAAGLDPGAVVHPARQILTELQEELAIAPDAIQSTRPFCVVVDQISGVVDIGIELLASTLSATDVLRAHRDAGSEEYSELLVISDTALVGFLASRQHQILRLSAAILEAARGSFEPTHLHQKAR